MRARIRGRTKGGRFYPPRGRRVKRVPGELPMRRGPAPVLARAPSSPRCGAALQRAQEGQAGREEVLAALEGDGRLEVEGLLPRLLVVPPLGPALSLVPVLADQRVVARVALQDAEGEQPRGEVLVVHPGALEELELGVHVGLEAQEQQ